MSSFDRFELSREHDPDGSRLRAALVSHFWYEQQSHLHRLLVNLLAIGNVLLWFAALWPHRWPRHFLDLLLVVWALVFLAPIVVGTFEYIRHQRWLRCLDCLSTLGD